MSDQGRVFSNVSGHLLAQPLDGKKYPKVTLCYGGQQHQRRVHRLVAEAFIPNTSPESLIEVNHKDLDRTNNLASNLEWVTPSGNRQHAVQNDCWANHKGENAWAAQLTNEQVLDIYKLRGTMTTREAQKKLGVHYAVVRNIWSGRRWSSVTGATPGQSAAKGCC